MTMQPSLSSSSLTVPGTAAALPVHPDFLSAVRRELDARAGLKQADALAAGSGPLTPADLAVLEDGLATAREQHKEAERLAADARCRITAITMRMTAAGFPPRSQPETGERPGPAARTGWERTDAITAAGQAPSPADRAYLTRALPRAEREVTTASAWAAAVRARLAGQVTRWPARPPAGQEQVHRVVTSAGPLSPAARQVLEAGLPAAEAAAAAAAARVRAVTACLESRRPALRAV